MWSAGLEFSRHTLFIALRMFRWVFPVIALLNFVSSVVLPSGGQGLAGVPPVFIAILIVLVPILLSLQVCLGFALYHGASPARRAFFEHAVKHAPAVIVTFLIVALTFGFAMLVPMTFISAIAPQMLGPLILMGACLAQMFGYITVARLVNGGDKIMASLATTGRFCLQNRGVLMVATLLVVMLPVVVDFGVDIMALRMAESGPEMQTLWRYLVQVPVMALTTSLAAAAGVIAVVEGDWSRTASKP